MASHEQCSLDRTAQKRYGDTLVGEGASAHLGDVSHYSQDVNIHGGLHLHYASPVPLQAIAAAGKVIEFLDVIDRLLRLGRQLDRNPTAASRQDIQNITNLLKDLQSTFTGLGGAENGDILQQPGIVGQLETVVIGSRTCTNYLRGFEILSGPFSRMATNF